MPNLSEIEHAVLSRDPQALTLVLDGLDAFANQGRIEPGHSGDPRGAEETRTCARLASALITALTDPALHLSDEVRTRLLFSHGSLTGVLAASAFEGPEVALSQLAPPGRGGDLAPYLALLSLDARIEIDLDPLFDAASEMGLITYLNLISQGPLTTAQGEARREALLEQADRLKGARAASRFRSLVLLSIAWMTCSYASGPRKHQLKRVLNEILLAFARGIGLPERLPPPPPRTRPVMLVAAEIMHSGHVQYRYFGQYLRQLRTRFHLVLLTDKSEADANVIPLFDEVRTFERSSSGKHLSDIARHFREAAPDVVFWLSVGMRHWGPLFANLRLAPMQFTAIGHSASTFCEPIDYYLIEEGYVSDPGVFGEKVLLLPDESLRFERAPIYTPIPPVLREAPEILRVAVPSNILKLNPSFIALLSQIEQTTARPLEFHFFPNASGPRVEVFRRLAQRSLRAPVIHRQLAYTAYLQALNACDLVLSPFPFGGLHSVVDALRQGLPVVAMARPEPHGMTDAMLLRRFDMPAWTVSDTELDYAAAALRVIEDDEERLRLSRQALALDLDRTMFGDGATPLGTDVVDLVWAVRQRHASVMADPRRSFRLADVLALSPLESPADEPV